MGLEDDVYRLEFSDSKDANLFYATVGDLLARLGFRHSADNYFARSKRYIAVRHNFDYFIKLLSKAEAGFEDISFGKEFIRPDLAYVKALTAYSNIASLRNGVFSYYSIGSNYTLGSNLTVKVRDNVFGGGKNLIAKKDFNDGFLTKIGNNYFFTLLSLLSLANNPKPVLKPHYVYES